MNPHCWTVRAVRSVVIPIVLLAAGLLSNPASAQVATYLFNNNLSAEQPGVVALTPVDPLGLNQFEADTVLGNARTVYHWNGTAAQNAGLMLDTTGLVAPDYSVEVVFRFLDNLSFSGWRRVLNPSSGGLENGLYLDSGNHLNMWTGVANAGTGVFTDTYHHIVLTNANTGTATWYLDGAQDRALATSVMNLSGDRLSFFIDNSGEFGNGKVALIRLYNSVLSGGEVAALARDPFPAQQDVPEPSAGLFLLAAVPSALFIYRQQNKK
jgi:hypothetical protein